MRINVLFKNVARNLRIDLAVTGFVIWQQARN